MRNSENVILNFVLGFQSSEKCDIIIFYIHFTFAFFPREKKFVLIVCLYLPIFQNMQFLKNAKLRKLGVGRFLLEALDEYLGYFSVTYSDISDLWKST